MAITGTKLFTSGEILTSTDVNQYLMRGIKVFATSTARDNAYGGAGEPTLEEGEVCYLTDTNVVQYYTGAAWVNLLDTTTGVAQSIVDAKGDLIAATAADTVARLAVGANSTYLRANSATATGLEWGALPITAVQSASVTTSQTTTSTAYTDLATVGPSVTITTGTSALVTICCTLSNSNNGPATSFMSHAISGATTVAASDVNAIRFVGGVWASGFGAFAKTILVTGLTAGSNTFTAKYRVSSDTGTFFDRTITVMSV